MARGNWRKPNLVIAEVQWRLKDGTSYAREFFSEKEAREAVTTLSELSVVACVGYIPINPEQGPRAPKPKKVPVERVGLDEASKRINWFGGS